MDETAVLPARRVTEAALPAPGSQPRIAAPLSRGTIAMLAAACGLAVANANYAQPLLVAMGESLHLSESMLGLIPALTQFGVTFGIAFLLPLGDVVSARRLLTVTILLQAAALAGVACAPHGTSLLLLSLLVGFFGITPYVLPPYATLRTAQAQRGRVTALLAQGVIVGMLLARSVSGVIGVHAGWRSVYALAALAMLLLLWPLRRTIPDEAPTNRTGYLTLMRSLLEVVSGSIGGALVRLMSGAGNRLVHHPMGRHIALHAGARFRVAQRRGWRAGADRCGRSGRGAVRGWIGRSSRTTRVSADRLVWAARVLGNSGDVRSHGRRHRRRHDRAGSGRDGRGHIQSDGDLQSAP